MAQSIETMPIANWSVVEASTQGANVLPNEVIRFTIPQELGYVDFHTSYLQLELQVTNANYKMALNGNCGAEVLIDSLRIYLDSGEILEEITAYNQLCEILVDYGKNYEERHFKGVLNNQAGNSRYDPGLFGDGAVSMTGANKVVKVCIPLSASGFFSNRQVAPLILLGNVTVEVKLAEATRCLKVHMPGNVFEANSGLGSEIACRNQYTTEATAAAVGQTFVTLRPPYCSFNGIADCPIVAGMHFKLCSVAVGGTPPVAPMRDITCTSLSLDDNGRIRVNFAATNFTGGGATQKKLVIGTGTDGVQAVATTTSYQVTRADLILQQVQPPAQYTQGLIAQAGGQGYEMDIETFVNYKANLSATVPTQTLEIPCFNSRCRSVVTCLRPSTQTVNWGGGGALDGTADRGTFNANLFNWEGLYENLQQYQLSIGDKREPVRPVVLNTMLGLHQHNSQEHLIEISKALHSAGVNVNSLEKARENFCLGRSLSKYGSSMSLVAEGLRWYVEYQNATYPQVALTPETYVSVIRRVVVDKDGVQVYG